MDENKPDASRPKPITPTKLVIPERDPNEKTTNWLRGGDTKSTSAKRKSDRRKKLLRMYIIGLFMTIAMLIVFGILGAVLWYLGPLKQDFWTPTGQVTAQLEGHDSPIRALSYTSDGKMLLSASEAKVALVWDLEQESILRQIRGHREPITSAVIGRRPAATSVVAQGESIQFEPGFDPMAAFMEVAPEDDAEDANPLKDYVAVTASEDMYAIKWNLDVVPPIPEIRFGEAEQKTGSLTSGGIYAPPAEDDMTPTKPENGHQAAIRCVAISDNGYYVLTGSDDTTAILWDPQTGKKYSTLSRHVDTVTAVALDPMGKTLATGSKDRTIYLWDLKTDAVLFGLTGHSGAILCLAYSKNGKSLVSGSEDSSAIVWNADLGTQFHRLMAETAVRSIGISSTGKYVLTNFSDTSAALWDVYDGKKVAQFHTPSPILVMAMSPVEDAHGKPVQIAIATVDRKILLFSVPGAKKPEVKKEGTDGAAAEPAASVKK